MKAHQIATKTQQELLDYYSIRLQYNLGLIAQGKPSPVYSPSRLAKWARSAAHAAYILHPGLRIENTLPRYLVAKAGRKMGFTGENLTWFVEKAFETGMAERFIPEELR